MLIYPRFLVKCESPLTIISLQKTWQKFSAKFLHHVPIDNTCVWSGGVQIDTWIPQLVWTQRGFCRVEKLRVVSDQWARMFNHFYCIAYGTQLFTKDRWSQIAAPQHKGTMQGKLVAASRKKGTHNSQPARKSQTTTALPRKCCCYDCTSTQRKAGNKVGSSDHRFKKSAP